MPKQRGAGIARAGPRNLQVGKLDDAIKRFFEIRGGFPLHLSPSVQPVITARELLEPPWNFYEGGHVGASPAGVAAQFSYVSFGPVVSNTNEVLVLDEIIVQAAGALRVYIGWGTVVAGTTLQGRFGDTRTGAGGTGLPSLANVRAEYGTSGAAWAGTTVSQIIVPGNYEPLPVSGVFVNGGSNPSPALHFYSDTVNQTVGAQARFRIYRVSQ